MISKLGVSVAALMLASSVAHASAGADCPTGNLNGSLDPQAAPDDNFECRFIGRIYCYVEQYRNAGLAEPDAVAHTAQTMNSLGKTGSHMKSDFTPLAKVAADSLYRRDKLPQWTAYYEAAFSCGVDKRIVDPGVRAKIGPTWEKAVRDCDKQHPGAGTGYPNDPLRNCLEKSMDQLVATAPKAAKK